MIRVVVADDQDLVRGGFAMILDAQPDIDVVAEAADGAEAVAAARTHAPDVILLDIRMPGMDGIEATRRICADTTTRVLILTTFDADDLVYEALSAGATGFLLKDVRRDALAEAVRTVAAGDSLLAPTVTRRLITDHISRPSSRPAADALAQLTTRERETLGHIARGLSNAEIAGAMTLSEHTVKTHVSNILTKLGLRDRVQAVMAAYESGLVVANR